MTVNREIRERTLFVRPNANKDLFYEGLVRSGFNVAAPFHGELLLLRAIRELFVRFRLPGQALWYNKRVLRTDADVLFVYDATVSVDYLKWLRKRLPFARIILLYNNRVRPSLKPNDVCQYCEPWGSDVRDLAAYPQMNAVPRGYYFDCYRMNKKQDPKYDVVYVGRDKGRLPIVDSLFEQFEQLGLVPYKYIVADHRYEVSKDKKHMPALTYQELLDLEGNSKAILSLSQGAVSGLTMRVYESIFNEIKLVSDDRSLLDLPFYDSDNFFIVGERDIQELKAFLDSPYHPINEEALEQFNLDDWVKLMLGSDGCYGVEENAVQTKVAKRESSV